MSDELVNHILNKDHLKVSAELNKVMMNKLASALEFKREEIAQSVFNGAPDPDEDEDEDDYESDDYEDDDYE
jgi:hypothetical protein